MCSLSNNTDDVINNDDNNYYICLYNVTFQRKVCTVINKSPVKIENYNERCSQDSTNCLQYAQLLYAMLIINCPFKDV